MKETVRILKIVILIIGFSLVSGEITFAQQTQSTAKQTKFLTPAEIVSEFEQMLNETDNLCSKMDLITYIAPAALAVGDTGKAKNYAQMLVTQAAAMAKSCDSRGEAIHVGNLILGRIALAAGNIAEAKYRLLEAGKTPGSAVLNSFGPNMLLAEELLEKNERAIVIEYFDLCAKFWSKEFSRLDDWKALVKKGGFPDFEANLRYELDTTVDAEMVNMLRKCLKKGC